MTPSIFDRRTIVRAVAGASLALELTATAGRARRRAHRADLAEELIRLATRLREFA